MSGFANYNPLICPVLKTTRHTQLLGLPAERRFETVDTDPAVQGLPGYAG